MRMSNQQKGFGLIELLISIVIGLIVVAGISSLVVATLRANTENLQMTRLTQEMRAVMQLVTRDLRRAGYDQNAVRDFGTGSQSNNQFTSISAFQNETDQKFLTDGIAGTEAARATCILFSYDFRGPDPDDPPDGEPQSSEFRGFKFDAATNSVKIKDSGSAANADCADGTGNWETLTDTATIRVDEFSISTVDGSSVPVLEDLAGNPILTVRELVITLDAGLVNDPDVQRSMRQTVRVRNDLLN